ncbi:50S ribosomal protein L30 [Alkaliphilus sp. MSJ-5]|uniref:Large ribosomal subunit protein uL30 n=1 Tax=Alkaliphilus flagellatus TaxID=2841507 RepID=A0ABS6G6K1_9FIRM|nr:MULTISPECIES: 50S ribosomal protein L30 [Alkaliphilus]MBU5678110.1 50S ribosomal protein L30 [Alkaliphilus flagellatus]QUH19894.1 50S ribosomal protein L30 [Alkaliphilus sp. B6464]
MAKVSIKLIRSVIGTKPNQRKTVEALGLNKIGQTTEKEVTPQIRGMIETVKHLVEVKEI